MKTYFPRLIESKIARKLQSSGAILVTGPKFCGKTTTCKLFQKSMIQLIDNDMIEIVSIDPRNALIGEYPRLIDEWQNVPELWNYIRKKIDDDGEFGEFILTGSTTTPDEKKIHHSGSGRITTIVMRPMSLFESKDSKGVVSLKNLFDQENAPIFDTNDDYSLSKTAFYICRGGWPRSIGLEESISLDVTKNYFDGLFNFKNSENKKYRNKKPIILKMVLKSYARNISTEAPYQTILKDVMDANKRSMDTKTFDSYIDILEELFIIEDMEAWTPNLRSKAAIRTTPTRHFVDPSIACMALNISPNDLMNDPHTFGLFFEDLAVRDLRIYAEALNGVVRHYRDSRGLECDAVIHLDDGRWAAIEIKLGSEKGILEGIKHLNELENSLDEKVKKPSFKMILVATGRAYRREDGIYVVPINLLKD